VSEIIGSLGHQVTYSPGDQYVEVYSDIHDKLVVLPTLLAPPLWQFTWPDGNTLEVRAYDPFALLITGRDVARPASLPVPAAPA
jgi:hypothetical protein